MQKLILTTKNGYKTANENANENRTCNYTEVLRLSLVSSSMLRGLTVSCNLSSLSRPPNMYIIVVTPSNLALKTAR